MDEHLQQQGGHHERARNAPNGQAMQQVHLQPFTGEITEPGEVAMEITHEMRLVRNFLEAIPNLLSSGISPALADETMSAVVNAMRRYAGQEVIQAVACHALAVIVLDGNGIACLWSKKALGNLLAGMRVILKAKDSGLGGPDLMAETCQAVFAIYDKSEQFQLREEPELTVLTEVIIKHVQNPKVVGAACRAMAKATRLSLRNKEILGKQAVKAVLLTLRKHKNSGDSQSDGVCAVAMLMRELPANAECFAEDEDVLPSMVRQLQTHIKHCELQHNACYMFHILSESCVRQIPAMLEAGIVSYLARAINQHEKDTECLDVVRFANISISKFISEYMRTGDAQYVSTAFARISQEGGAEVLVSCAPTLLEKHTETAWSGFVGVRNLLFCCPDLVKDFGLRAIRPIITCMQRCVTPRRVISKDHAAVLIFGCSLISKLLDCARSVPNWRQFQDEFGRCGGVKTLAKCLQVCNSDAGWKVVEELMQERGVVYINAQTLPGTAVATVTMCIHNHAANQSLCAAESEMYTTLRAILSKTQNQVDEVLQQNAVPILLAIVENGGNTVAGNSAASESVAESESESVLGQTRGADVSAGLSQLRVTNKASSNNHKSSKNGAKDSAEACVACGKTAADVGVKKLLKCSACTVAPRYCSAACQHACWKAHKAECRANKNAAK